MVSDASEKRSGPRFSEASLTKSIDDGGCAIGRPKGRAGILVTTPESKRFEESVRVIFAALDKAAPK